MAVRSIRQSPREQERPEDLLFRQIRSLKQLAASYRDAVYGVNHFDDIEDFYNLALTQGKVPSFRPQVQVPHLQLMGVTEASDLADANPKIYIVGKDGKRQKERETALQSQWRASFVNNQLMLSSIWAWLNGNGYVQLGFDRFGRNGKGQVWARTRNPREVFEDPAATCEDDRFYLVLEDRLYPEQLEDAFPQTGKGIMAPPPSGISEIPQSTMSLSLPANSPMSIPGGAPGETIGPSDGRITSSSVFIFDPTVIDEVHKANGADAAKEIEKLVPNRFTLKYPNGRLIVSGGGRVFFDGDNPYPRRSIPLVRVLGMPSLNSIYAPAPMKYTSSLQSLAERMLSQTFENAVRLNNGVWFIPSDCGITPEDFGGIPGEVRVYNSQAGKPTMEVAKPFPPHMTQFPELLLKLQEKLQGFTQTRQGNPGAGNVGSDLFDAAVMQSQSLSRMRGKLMAESVQRIAEQFFYLMASYYKDDQFPDFSQGFDMAKWPAIGPHSIDEFELHVDEASIAPLSQMAMQKLVPILKKEGMMSTKNALETLNIPGAAEEADAIEKEQSLQALARVQKRH
jgi:hypothetical protein